MLLTPMPQLKMPLIGLLVFLLVSCGANKPSETKTSSSSANSSQEKQRSSSQATQPVSSSRLGNHNLITKHQKLISPEGIGKAKLGITLGELKQVLETETELQTISPFIVDFDAIAIQKDNQAQYYILYPAGTSMTDEDTIQTVATDNPNYQTVEGIGPKTSLEAAETVYGEATLSYHTANESREYVSFAQQSSPNLAFRVGTTNNKDLAGIYPSSQQEFNETQEYKDIARIRWIEVSCRKNC